jgi:hypothetical protein
MQMRHEMRNLRCIQDNFRIFKVDAKFDPSRQPDKILQVQPLEFLRPPHGNSKDEDFAFMMVKTGRMARMSQLMAIRNV